MPVNRETNEAAAAVPPVGTSVPRVDGEAKVRGGALYVDDLPAPGALHGATVRSQVPHGVLRAIRRDPAFDWTDVVVATAADIPGKNTIYLIEEDQPALVPVGGRIRHVDEPVALVAAPTRRRAQEAAAHIILEVDELPAIHTIDDALRAEVVLHGADNVFKRFHIRKGGDVEAALAAADLIVEGTYWTGAQEQMYIEPQGMIARFDDDGSCHIVGSLQCPYYVHKAMKPLFGLADHQVVIAQSVTGGGFGGKEEYPSMIAAHAALLARVAGRPVKLVYDRDEDIGATTKRHPARVRHRMGLRRDGTIAAIDVDVVFDGGAYLTLSPVVLSRGVLHAAGPYRCETVRVVGRAVATNTPPHGAFRGFGAPQTTFAYERQIEKAARLLGLDPFEMRRRNMLRSGDATATSQVLTYSVGSDEVLESVAAASGEVGPRASGGGAAPPVRRGRGLAFYFHGAGFTGSGEQRLAGRATVALLPGGRFEVRSSSTDIGQGALTIFSQIAATALGVDIARVAIAEQSTGKVPDSGPTVASRTCMVVGGVVDRASTALRRRIEEWAAAHGLAGAPIAEAAEAMAAATAAAGVGGEEVAETAQYVPPPGIQWDDDTYTGSAYPVYGWACCLVDVAVDLDTYEVTVERCVHAVDVGRAIHPILVKGQIEGGTLQALGWALWESVVYQRGRVVNRRMTDCIVPTFADAPEMETILVEKPYPFGPHGAKGVGEIPMDGPAAAVANAIEDALGVPFDSLPVLPETIERALAGSAPTPARARSGR
ncbi:MAG TPA: xanthine dehydrogenase family protein molybdopterin-binding subunit [Kofleriaceae bacterium]|nr:xanthine dehydrogenase family protein molybdopterin-binding subunit [Kofleriaceae bacterium]